MQLYLQNCQKHPELDKGNDFSINSLLLEVTAPYITMHKSARHLENQRRKRMILSPPSAHLHSPVSLLDSTKETVISSVSTQLIFFFFLMVTQLIIRNLYICTLSQGYIQVGPIVTHNLKILCYSRGFFP